MDRLASMSILVSVAEAGSFSAAARKLGSPLATVSRKVADLEAALKTILLVRSVRGLTLTDSGRAYVQACRRILDEIGAAERAAAGEYARPRGELVITAPVAFGRLHVLPIVTLFLKDYREIDIRMILGDRILNLADDHVDLAVRLSALADSSLIATNVDAIRTVVCANPTYFAARGVPKKPEDLNAHDCVAFEGLSASDVWTFGVGKSARLVSVRSRLAVNTAEAAIDAAIAGLGITRVLSYQVAQALRDKRLMLALESFEPPPRPANLVYAGGALMPAKLRAFIDFAAPKFRARLARGAR